MKKNKQSRKSRIQIILFLLIIAIILPSPLCVEASERQSITVKANDSISFLCFKIYGRFNPKMTQELVTINPHIKDWNNLAKGKEITFLSQKEMNSIVPEQKRETVVITFLKQPVIIKKDTKGPHKKALLNMILNSQDRVEVKNGGSVELMMSHGRVIRLDEGSILMVGTLMRDEHKKSVVGKFKLFLGRLWGKVLQVKLRKKKEMYVSTPTLVAGVRGTAYDLQLKRDQSSIIKVFEGEVEIYNPLQKMPESGIIKDFKKPHRVQGPHRITEKEWNELLLRQYQQVIVTKEGISIPISFDHEAERKTEWVKCNEQRDIRLSGKEIL